MRVVALDLGERRVGVAVSDSGGVLATPYSTVERTGDPAVDLARLVAVVRELEAGTVVVGLPLSLSGARGPAADKVLAEADALAEVLDAGTGDGGPDAAAPVPVVLSDERLTTVTAERSLRAQKVKGRTRRRVIDQVAATVILQHWLDGDAARRARVGVDDGVPTGRPVGDAP